jgi:hypothetical protein
VDVDVDVDESGDAGASHSFSAWSMLRGVPLLNMTEMRISVRTPALPHKFLLLVFLYSLVEVLKPMTNQSLTIRTIRMRRVLLSLLLTPLNRTVEASMG